VINLGVDHPTTFLELVDVILEAAGGGSWEFAPFTPERKAQEPGDFYSDIAKARRLLGWEPTTTLVEGMRRTMAYYRAHRAHYWETAAPARKAG
jgi:UDP-glucose 4-epimerase